MKKVLGLAVFMCVALAVNGQSFEVQGLQEHYHGIIGHTIKAPLQFRNTTNGSIILTIRKISGDIGSTQKHLICIDYNCSESDSEEFQFKIEPGQTLNSVSIGLEAGLIQGESSIKYTIFNKINPADAVDIDLHFRVDEKIEKASIYTSSRIVLHDVYPNPVRDHAYVEYRILNEETKAKIRIHNILGNTIEEFPLFSSETRAKIKAETFDAGVYFYTLYLDNEGVLTRKLIVKK